MTEEAIKTLLSKLPTNDLVWGGDWNHSLIGKEHAGSSRLTSNALYLHRSAISSLEPILRVFEGCAKAYLGDVDDANVVKLHRFSGKVSYLACPKFETHPHPPIRRTIKLSLRNLFLQCIDHSENKNPLLLDQKERMIESDHPWRERFARFSGQEYQHGLLDGMEDMLPALQWHEKLQEAGLMIRGYRLLYQEGVKRKRLPPKQNFTGSAKAPDTEISLPEVTNEVDPHEMPAVAAIDSDTEDESVGPLERVIEMPTRSRRFGVGKEIGYAVYVHRNYEERLGATVEWAKRHLPENYEYTVVKLNQRNDSVSFILCPNFDLDHEPAIAAILVVNADGATQRRTTPADPYIYHHKWLFVDDDYPGFQVHESKARSLHWISLGDVDRSRIGRASFWNEHVVPRLISEMPERWVRSDEARKQLKLSTCDLAHARESGAIELKKVGNAFFYKLP